ncbi:putative ATP-dependent bile acid permease [Operophtera brumata]|uniref:Putative ATP-dependent bile acid permease n=1 Tax=Operophtera brumata TaxID=104452 RepID=A0A0L7L648_OPEBR|nr:putative ATP-dependent bile acid permease [Operophtera brumata]
MIGLVGMCQYGMRQTAEVENQMTSVSTAIDSYRLVRYCSVGLAITQIIGLVGMCQYGMRQTAEVENQMTSVSTAIDSLDTVAWD